MLNFQAVVSQFFEWQTSLVVRWPLPFVIIPPLITVVITTMTFTDLHLNVTNDTLRVFLPDDIRALRELEELLSLFPPRDAMRDSYSIFGTSFAYWVYESKNGNAVDASALVDLARLHSTIKSITSSDNSSSFDDVCLSSALTGGCALHPFAFALEDPDPVLSAQFMLRYPLFVFANLTVDNAVVFGGVSTRGASTRDSKGNYAIDKAKSVRMAYTLQHGDRSNRWISAFLDTMPKLQRHFPNATLYWTSSQSLAKEMERNGHLLIPWMPWMSLVLVVFCMLICSSRDAVRSQPWVGFCAMLNATMATIASTSTLLYLQYPFLPLVFIMPFLVVSIGTDNMFLMLKSWRMGHALDVEDRFTEALTETAASLFLTSLTDGLSFSIGGMADFYAVRVFCTYCAMAILFMFIYQITFFNALMVFCCRREIASRHWLFCYNVTPIVEEEKKAVKMDVSSEWPSRLSSLIQFWPTRLFIFIVYLVYIVVSVNLCLALPLGLDLKLLAPDNSYVSDELLVQERLYNDFGTFCFGVVKTKNIKFGEPLERRRLTQLYEKLSSGSDLVSSGEFWLRDFETAHEGKSYSHDVFIAHLFRFLGDPLHEKYKNDIRFSLTGQIEAIKLILRVRKVSPANDEPRAEFLRSTMENSRLDGFIYDTSFLLVDQQMTTVENVVSNVVSAVITMLVICVLMVPRLVSSLCVALAILSINEINQRTILMVHKVGVVGALSAVKTRLDIISMITIVMSVGFSVDYVVHTTFHYVTQKTERLERCLRVMVEPILQSALSTAVGVALLGLVPSYIVRTFVFTVLFVVVIGVIHGLVFLPALLITVVPSSEYLEPYSSRNEQMKDRAKHKVSRGFVFKSHHITRLGVYDPTEVEYATPPKEDVSIPAPAAAPRRSPRVHSLENGTAAASTPVYRPVVKPRTILSGTIV